MLDIKKIRKDPDFTKEKLATRGVKPETIDELLSFDAKRRDLIVESESLKAQRNDVSDQISQKSVIRKTHLKRLIKWSRLAKRLKPLMTNFEKLKTMKII